MVFRSNRIGGMSFDAILLTSIKLVTAVIGLAITRILSEYLSVHAYGTYSQILLIVSSVSAITIFGMEDGVNYFYCRESDVEKREAYTATILTLQCTIGCAAGCVVIFLAIPLCKYFDNPDIYKYIIFAASLPLFQNIMRMLQVLFVSIGKARLLAFRNLVVSVVRLGAVFVVAFLFNNIVVVLLTTVILDLAQIAFFWCVLRRSGCRFRFSRINNDLVRDIIKYCAPMAIFLIINSLNRDMDKYLVSMMTDTETLAMYANASKQLPFDILMASFCTVLIPNITRSVSQKENKSVVELYNLFLEISYITTGILCFAALSAAPQLMKLLYSNKYTDGLAIFCVYILVDLIRFTNITLVLSAAGKTKRLMLIGGGSLALNLVLNAILFRLFGIIGPAIATLSVTALTGIVMLYCSAKVLDTSLSKFFDLKYLLLFASESVTLVLIMNRFQAFLDRMDVHYFVILIIVAGCYGVLMMLLNGKRLLDNLKKVNRIS